MCEFLPHDRPELWADKILAARKRERRNMYKEIVYGGYDISSTAAWLQDFYIRRPGELQKER